VLSFYIQNGTINILFAILTAALAIISFGLVGLFQIQNCNFAKLLWLSSTLLMILTIVFVIYRLQSNINVSFPKEKVDWINIRKNAVLIEKIGQQQAKACKVKLDEGDSIAAFTNFVKERLEEFKKNTNPFTRLYKTPEKFPDDKIPNIIKMYVENQDVEKSLIDLNILGK
jgi:hypothetical protein